MEEDKIIASSREEERQTLSNEGSSALVELSGHYVLRVHNRRLVWTSAPVVVEHVIEASRLIPTDGIDLRAPD